MSNLEKLEDLSKDELLTTFDPTCIRQKSNWSKIKKEHKLDNGFFDSDVFLNDIKNASPKLDALLKKIDSLDKKDEKNHGKKFKHFIFSDLKSGGHGAKMLAAALISTGWTLGYKSNVKGAPDSKMFSDSASDSGYPALNLQEGPVKFKGVTGSPNFFDISSKGGASKEKDNDKTYHENNDEDDDKNSVKWGPIQLLDDSELMKSRGYNFYLLSSVAVFDKPISVKIKKEILGKFNSRPDNIHGDLARIIIMDSGFKEGIDLFDIKYIHIFEPSVNAADQKQVIGRGTRTCGQKGLEFSPTKGWPLHVFVYDLEIPGSLQSSLLGATSTFDLLMKAMNVDIRLINFGYDIERLSVLGSVDYELNQAVHNFSVNLEDEDEEDQVVFGGRHLKYGEVKGQRRDKTNRMTFQKMRTYINEHFGQYKWEDVKMENLCVEKGGQSGGGASILNYTPSQNFIRNYFKPSAPVKGMLLHHSVGTGKTCSAIAAASTNFEPAGYTILWVTRTTLKNDIWKNMFGQVCNESIRSKIVNGESIPDDPKKQMRLLSNAWRIRPMSYKQFSNLVSKRNNFYKRLVKENGEVDPLRKTLLIIDEAHKLYGGGDLSSIERPDMVALHESLMKSYAISGEDSVRLLLMTATPITESPMELIKLVNLCKPMDEQMPHTFDTFSSQYLNEQGHFTQKGEHEYLDNIAGHISYLNREKDARQFSQPIVKRVLVPVATEAQLENMAQYDKFVFKSSANESVMKLKEQAEKMNEKLKGELSEMGKERFNYLKAICDEEEVPMKLCKKIITKNVKALTSEIKEYIKSIKSQLEVIKSEIKKVSSEKTKGLEKIKKNIEQNPEDFEKYKNSTYFSIRTFCGKRTRTNKELLDQLETHPDVVKYNAEIKEHEDHIQMLKNKLALDTKAYKEQIKQLKKSLKSPGLSDLEKSMIELTIKDHQANFKTTRKLNTKQLKTDLEQDTKAIKYIKKAKKDIYKSVRKTMKNRLKEEKKELALVKKEEKRLRKTIRKESDIKDDIADEEVKQIVDKYEKIIKDEVEEAADEAAEEIQAKANAKKAREEEKQKKQEEAEKAKKAKEEEKQKKQEEAEKAKKAKEEEKQKKQEEAEKAKKAKQEEAEKAKKAKQEEAKAKADKAKTEKLRAKEASDKAKTAKLREKELEKQLKKAAAERDRLEKLAKKAALDKVKVEKAAKAKAAKDARKTKKRSPTK
jgi:hypothetical protein